MLRVGNQRYISAASESAQAQAAHLQQWRSALATDGQQPAAVVIGCADSRCPVEILFDAQPGDIFVLRNAGNTCVHAEGSMVGSVEYAVGKLGTRLVLVLGHTKCGAIAGATAKALAKLREEPRGKMQEQGQSSLLDKLLDGLAPVAAKAAAQLPKDASAEEIAAHAVKVNIFNTIEKLLSFSDLLQEKARNGEVVLCGGVYDLATGQVEFLHQSPGSDEHPAYEP